MFHNLMVVLNLLSQCCKSLVIIPLPLLEAVGAAIDTLGNLDKLLTVSIVIEAACFPIPHGGADSTDRL